MSLSVTCDSQPTCWASETASAQYSLTASLAPSARSMSSCSNSLEGVPSSFSGVGSTGAFPQPASSTHDARTSAALSQVARFVGSRFDEVMFTDNTEVSACRKKRPRARHQLNRGDRCDGADDLHRDLVASSWSDAEGDRGAHPDRPRDDGDADTNWVPRDPVRAAR